MDEANKCYQCGRSELAITEEDPDWVVCGHCGEKIVTAREFRASIEKAQEEKAKRALGFYDFKRTGE